MTAMKPENAFPGGRLYGKLRTAGNPAWAAIWRSRNEELPSEPPMLTMDQICLDPETDAIESGQALMCAARELLSPKEWLVVEYIVMHGMTVTEVAKMLGKSQQAIWSFQRKAYMKLRKRAFELGITA